MSSYSYVAVDPQGTESRGVLEVADQSEAVRRIREMGLFPTKVLAADKPRRRLSAPPTSASAKPRLGGLSLPGWGNRIKAPVLAVFTRQLATLVEAGLPLLRGLKILHEQAEDHALRRVLQDLAGMIENGSSFAEALSLRPKVFNALYINMVKAGELSGALDITLRRLAEFMEKSQRIKGKVKAAMYYPCAVLSVAMIIFILMLTFIVPRFKTVFEGLLGGGQMPKFTVFILHLSDAVKSHIFTGLAIAAGLAIGLALMLRTDWGRWAFDKFKLAFPLIGPVFRKVAISRFSRTLGTLLGSGVPVLQALTIVKETTGNVVVGKVILDVHQQVKEGDPIAPTLKASGVFPAMVAGMVDVGEQTGALPEMLMKISDTYDDEVDNAVNAMTSLLEPIMIVILAVIVGSIVVALFLPLVGATTQFDSFGSGRSGDN